MSVEAAAARSRVRLADGRHGRLLSWPAQHGRTKGRRARVRLASDAVISVDAADVTVEAS